MIARGELPLPIPNTRAAAGTDGADANVRHLCMPTRIRSETFGKNRSSEPIDRQRDSNLLRTNEANYQNQCYNVELTEYTQ
jgi:hypothetical protein